MMCQVHRPIPRQPQQELTPITSPWPFHKWGIDIAGPFPVAAGGLKFLIVAIDYFTKWTRAKRRHNHRIRHWREIKPYSKRFVFLKTPTRPMFGERRANRSLGEGIKARLDRHKGRWVEELSHVLWAHRTTIKVSTGDTPFSLVYGTEAVIPPKYGMPTYSYRGVNIANNDDEPTV
ncbi:reverse transcriptase domain-containing protein [Tanacetum coccineum]